MTPRNIPRLSREVLARRPPGVWKYQAFLPRLGAEDVVSLGEGGTPLLPAARLGNDLALDNLLIKDETRNPTGSFIDRGSTVLMSLAKERGITACSCVTTGNLGASLAAYCAKAGIEAKIKIHPNTDRGKLYQMIAFGAHVEAYRRQGNVTGSRDSLLVTAKNPYILEGEKTTCFEIVQDLGWNPPDVIVVPVGTGGHLTMIWRAIQELRKSKMIGNSKCRLLGVRFQGPSPEYDHSSAEGWLNKVEDSFTELEESEPIFKKEAVLAMKASGGEGLETTMRETIKATSLLARTEGIFAEPASASVVASLQRAKARGLIGKDETVVCIITGAGLKDTRAISKIARPNRRVVVRNDYAVARVQVGETKLTLMRSLVNRPSFGYSLWKDFSLLRKITTASIYQHLGELEELAFVRKSSVVTVKGKERVFYELTRKGSDFVRISDQIGEPSRQSDRM